MKKIVSIVLALALVFALSVTAMAAYTSPNGTKFNTVHTTVVGGTAADKETIYYTDENKSVTVAPKGDDLASERDFSIDMYVAKDGKTEVLTETEVAKIVATAKVVDVNGNPVSPDKIVVKGNKIALNDGGVFTITFEPIVDDMCVALNFGDSTDVPEFELSDGTIVSPLTADATYNYQVIAILAVVLMGAAAVVAFSSKKVEA